MTIGLSQRECELFKLLAEDGHRSVAALSKALGVSAVTLRSDLAALADKGIIVRTHGGAFPAFRPNILERHTDGFSIGSGITANSVETATAARKMAEQAQRTILLADSSKYGRDGFAHIMALKQVSLVVTDHKLGDEHRRLLEENQVQVKVV